jgi:predicted transcriptional regulator
MNLLLSIQPIIARRITSGKKKYEYRRTIFKKEVRYIYLYSSSPVRKIVCRFRSSGCLAGSIDEIWEKTGKLSAASEAEYRDYFRNTRTAYAIKIDDLEVFENPLDPYRIIPAFRPPQSFMYIPESFDREITSEVLKTIAATDLQTSRVAK